MNQSYEAALKSIPAPGDGCHPYLMRVANLGARAGLSSEQITADIRSAIPYGRRRVPEREIVATAEKAAREADTWAPSKRIWSTSSLIDKSPAPPKLNADGLLAQIMADGSADEADLWETSPVRLDGRTSNDASLLLKSLYNPEEILFLGDIYDTEVKSVSEWIAHIKQYGAGNLPHIIPNPVDGKPHELADGKHSWRCDAAIQKFRFATVEFDGMSRANQLCFWSGVLRYKLLDIACLIDSGGKSIHAWIKIDLPTRDAWDHEIRYGLFEKWLIPLGVDSSTRNPARLSRLPGHKRTETGNLQRVLWLKARSDQ